MGDRPYALSIPALYAQKWAIFRLYLLKAIEVDL
jgi:hypothetical protein